MGSHCWGRQGLGGTELQSKAVKSEASKLKRAGKLQYKTKNKIIKIINKLKNKQKENCPPHTNQQGDLLAFVHTRMCVCAAATSLLYAAARLMRSSWVRSTQVPSIS